MANHNLLLWNKYGDIRAIWSVLILVATMASIANPLVLLLDATDIPLLESSLKNACVALSVILALYLICRLSIYSAADFGWSTSKGICGRIGFGVAAGAVPICLYVAIGSLLGLLSWQNQPGTLFESSVAISLLGQGVRYVSGSLFEEAVARGFLFYLVLTRINLPQIWRCNLVALASSSVVFSLLHLGNPDLNMFALLNLTLAGIWFGLLYLGTGNLLAPVVAHFSWNFFQNNIFGMPNGGGESKAWIMTFKPEVENVLTGGRLGPEGSVIICLLLTILVLLMIPWSIKRQLIYDKPTIATE